jgi:hypothetical protein
MTTESAVRAHRVQQIPLTMPFFVHTEARRIEPLRSGRSHEMQRRFI